MRPPASQIAGARQPERQSHIEERGAAVMHPVAADLGPQVTPELVVERNRKERPPGDVEGQQLQPGEQINRSVVAIEEVGERRNKGLSRRLREYRYRARDEGGSDGAALRPPG